MNKLLTLAAVAALPFTQLIAQESPATPASEEKATRPQLVAEREVVTRLQIFLDQQHFPPGKIDGRWGEFTGKSLGRYADAHGLPRDESLYAQLPLDSVHPLYTTYTIQPDDLKQVGDAPSRPAEQAKKKKMPYRSLLEFLAERYHADPDFLVNLNPSLNLDALKPGDTVRVPNVEPFKVEGWREIAKLPEIPEFLQRTLTVDTEEKMAELRDEKGALLAAFPITPGSGRLPAPKGKWKILGIAIMPWFRHDEGVLNRGVRTDDFHNIPPGPNNPVGVVWMGLNKPGIGLHGTNNPQTIGRAGSHGCIRLANWDAIRLAYLVTRGMTVEIK